MSDLITLVAGVVTFVVAAVLARPVGRRLKDQRPWARLLVGASIAIAATALLVFAASSGTDLLWGMGVGLGLGGTSGLRYGEGTLVSALTRSRGGGAGGTGGVA